jgi:hypothetical protein
MQRLVPVGGNAVCDGAFKLRSQRKHGPENFAERGEIVAGDPAGQAQQLVIEYRRDIEDGKDELGFDCRFAIVKFDNYARHALLAEGYQHTSPDYWRGFG